MKAAPLKTIVFLSLALSLFACKNEPAAAEAPKTLPMLPETKPTKEFSDAPGIAGIVNVAEMIALTRLDSAPAADVATRMKIDFNELDEDFRETGAELDGPQGILYYNRDPENFKFECVVLIKYKPIKPPKHSRVVTLGQEKMLIYNHYGSYETTFRAYEDIRRYCGEKRLEQVGLMREFYPASFPGADSTKRLTRIMVPVAQF